MHWILVVNGSFIRTQYLADLLATADCLVGVDGGCAHIHALGATPHIVIGDLDSVAAERVTHYTEQGIEIIRHSPHKDYTDLELALELALERGAGRITVLAATGGRLDHSLANILALSRCLDRGVRARIIDEHQAIALIDQDLVLEGRVGDIVSILPLTEKVCEVWLTGLRYPLHGETLLFGSSRGVSNILTAPQARIQIGAGRMLVVHQYAQHDTVSA